MGQIYFEFVHMNRLRLKPMKSLTRLPALLAGFSGFEMQTIFIFMYLRNCIFPRQPFCVPDEPR